MNPNDAIRVMQEYVEADRKMRDNSTKSDYDKFCEGKNLAIEELIRLAEIGQATEKAFANEATFMFVPNCKDGYDIRTVGDLIKLAKDN